MLRIYEAVTTGDWRCYDFGVSQGIGDVSEALSGFLIGITDPEPPISVYTVTDTGILSRIGQYGDSRQQNNAIVHRDIEGAIHPKELYYSKDLGPTIYNYTTARGTVVSWAYREGVYDCKRVLDSTPDSIGNYCKGAHSIYAGYWDAKVFSIATLSGTFECIANTNKPGWEKFFKEVTVNFTYGRYKPRSPGVVPYAWAKGGVWKINLPQYMNYERCAQYIRTQISIFALDNLSAARSLSVGNRRLNEVSFRFVKTRLNEKMVWFGSHELSRSLPFGVAIPSSDETELYRTALSGQNCFTGNGIAYAADLGKVGDSIRALLSLVASPTDPKKWAGAYLSARFSDRLTVQDTKELFGSIRGQLQAVIHSISYRETRASRIIEMKIGLSDARVQSRARLRCDNESYSLLMTSIKKFLDWDVWPTLENAWDLIPLSFVVDWFLNLSTILTNIDTLVYQQYLKVRFYERSDKATYTLPTSEVLKAFGANPNEFSSSVTAKIYFRRSAPRPQLGIMDGWSPSLPAPVNLLDLDALLVQML